jgi:hypothetical protein
VADAYRQCRLGHADDVDDADGREVLSFSDALRRAASCLSRASTFGSALRQDTASRTTCGWSTVSCFGVAVLWERSVTDDDDVVESCALVTVPANRLLAEIDNTTGQMPAILRREDYDTWLRSRVAEASELLETYPQTRMVSHPVAPYVNHLEFDEPRLIQPAPQEPVQ